MLIFWDIKGGVPYIEVHIVLSDNVGDAALGVPESVPNQHLKLS
jgi:hypothetical protein